MRKGFLIYEEMLKYFPIYEEAVSHIWLCNCSILNFLIYEENLIFFFISEKKQISTNKESKLCSIYGTFYHCYRFYSNVVSEYSETSEKPLIVNYYGRGKPVPGGVAAPPTLRDVGGAGGSGDGACL